MAYQYPVYMHFIFILTLLWYLKLAKLSLANLVLRYDYFRLHVTRMHIIKAILFLLQSCMSIIGSSLIISYLPFGVWYFYFDNPNVLLILFLSAFVCFTYVFLAKRRKEHGAI